MMLMTRRGRPRPDARGSLWRPDDGRDAAAAAPTGYAARARTGERLR
ncbi:hypothetical protein H4W31_006184 [Plantactinospora soyae]|uniref:Uncharacterized protein n=1 Tax=Plantactinospora soyae TaxID=1544732 RepID=A0A927RA93_9ACTN|nr:hypothetical protein [Plantactinospora soyae]